MSDVTHGSAQTNAAATEAWLINASREVGLHIAGDDDFFDAGGNSLTIVRLIAKADARFGTDLLTAEEFFESSTVREIAEQLAGKLDGAEEQAAERGN